MAEITILVVDDDPTNRFVLSKMLKHRGYTVAQAESGAQAIECVSETSPAVVLMDINMPGMTGVEAARKIASMLGEAAPKIVAVTANNTTAQRAECAAAGFQGFLAKPVKMQVLFDALEEGGRSKDA